MKTIGVLTSGGDSPGMNAAIRAVVRTASYHGVKVFGIERGYQGLIDGQMREMGARDVGGIINRGGTILKTARCKAFFDVEGRNQAAAQLARHGIEGLVAIGGDGTYRGAQALHAEHGIRCIGVPGTIDNDIGGTDYTIGYDTALNIALEAIDRIRDTAESHDRVFFIEVMGRRSGYIAMMSGLAGGAEEILVPETETNLEELAKSLAAGKARGKTSSIVVVAEGDEAGRAIDIAHKVGEFTGCTDYRVAIIGHLQRGGSPTASDRILASRLGARAVEALIEGETGKMAGLRGDEAILCPLSDAWEKRTQFNPSLCKLAKMLSV
ncbi:MAG: 6-phosphofructokinase [FCB group bacterium]|jgi:6-phosphofructokinase 1|nr:6-phosphofructokinase [FCB group bacterium]